MKMSQAFTTVLLSVFAATAWSHPHYRIHDLSHVMDESTLGWLTVPWFKLNVRHNGTTEGGFWLQEEEYSSGTHVGTHLDAPCHFAKGRWTVDQIPLNRFTAQAAIVDISEKVRRDRDALLDVRDLVHWEAATHLTLDFKILLVRTGWSKKWPNEEAYYGNADKDVNKLNFPGISAEAAQWLVDHRQILGVGTDTASLDNGPSKDFKAHQILLGANVYGMENLSIPDELPPYGAILHVSPIKIKNACGAPASITAYVPPAFF